MEMGNIGDRRVSRRYGIVIGLRYRVSEGRATSGWRTGRTCDISSTGVSFRCGHALPTDAHLELVIDWPSTQSTLHPICLRAAGHVVRSDHGKVAVRMTSCRMVIEQATSPPVMAASSSGM
jgi:hypothetical protein